MPIPVHLYVAHDAARVALAEFGGRLRSTAAGPALRLGLSEAVGLARLDRLPVRAIRMALAGAQVDRALRYCWWAREGGGTTVDPERTVEMRSRTDRGVLLLEAVPCLGLAFAHGQLRVLLAQLHASLLGRDPVDALLESA